MQDFTIKVSPDTFVRVQAENEKDARAIVLAEIAKREGSKVHDQVFFDYDTGIKNKTLRRFIYLLIVMIVMIMGNFGENQFIYFQF